MKKFKNKYRISSTRLQSWDYRNKGAYFITICTANRNHFFGDVENGEMQLNEIGQLADKFWKEIPDHFPFVKLGNFVIMPDHTHGILIIDKPVEDTPKLGVSTDLSGSISTDPSQPSTTDPSQPSTTDPSQPSTTDPSQPSTTDPSQPSTTDLSGSISTDPSQPSTTDPSQPSSIDPSGPISKDSSPSKKTNGGKNEKWKSGSIGVIINQYKRAVTIKARKINPKFEWQSRFHDHIIRNSTAFERIQNYIENNPVKWGEDKSKGK